MIIGFLGKGGSGKSSVSSQTALFSISQNKSVLAIDADHNMDLSYNLSGGDSAPINYFSESLLDLQNELGLKKEEKYMEAFLSETDIRFSLKPLSQVIQTYSVKLSNNIRLMAAGPQTDTVLYGKACSHILTTPLKILLPLLQLEKDEVVVVDEKAGADGVSTGIVTGIDVGMIVCEPAIHSIKTAKQIAELMDFYQTPYMFVGNKIRSTEDEEFITLELGAQPVVFLRENNSVKRTPSLQVMEWSENLKALLEKAEELNQNNRLERTIKKFRRNQDFQ